MQQPGSVSNSAFKSSDSFSKNLKDATNSFMLLEEGNQEDQDGQIGGASSQQLN